MTRTAEDSARRLLWLFPRWVRAGRGEEALGVVLDQLPSDARRLPLASRLDLIRAGLHGARRATPPPAVWFEVLLVDPRNNRGLVPEAWQPWLVDWLQDPRWKRRYVVRTVLALLVALVALLPVLRTGDGAGVVINGFMWIGALAVMQSIRAPRWRWLVALRNGMVPGDLHRFPSDAVKVGLVRPLWANWSALRATSIAALVLVTGLVGNLVVTLGIGVEQRAARGADLVFLAAQLVVAIGILAVPALVRMRRVEGDRPRPPAPDALVERARSRWSQAAWSFALAFWLVMAGWRAVVQGALGAALLGGLLLVTAVLAGSLVLTRRRLGRPVGIWEAWPATGPQPFLLVREDVLQAEGLKGSEARRSSQPGSLA